MSTKVLIVDDIFDDFLLLKRHLKRIGYDNVKHVSNGYCASEIFKDYQNGVIFIDTQMPEFNGYETFNLIKNQGCNNIGLIGMSDSDCEKEWINIGADGFISKIKFQNEENLSQLIKKVVEKYNLLKDY